MTDFCQSPKAKMPPCMLKAQPFTAQSIARTLGIVFLVLYEGVMVVLSVDFSLSLSPPIICDIPFSTIKH